MYSIDEFGRAAIDSRGLFELWFQGIDEHGLVIDFDDEIVVFNEQCIQHDKPNFVVLQDTNPPLTHAERSQQWLIPDEYQTLNVEDWCLALCASDMERDRVRHEMVLYIERGMLPVLRTLIYMVNVLRANNILWGVGRGSSVASYLLFLIGVHRIDSIKFGLQIEDFLRS